MQRQQKQYYTNNKAAIVSPFLPQKVMTYFSHRKTQPTTVMTATLSALNSR